VGLLRRRDRRAPGEESHLVADEETTRHALLPLLALAVCLLATPVTAQLYRWTDAEGTVHYTADRAAIPLRFRDAATLLNAPQARPAPSPEPNAPVSIRVTPGAPLTVEARLNGTPLTLIVDTGADRTVISPTAIERAGLAGQAGRSIQVVGVTGTATATLLTLPLLDVAGARIGPLPVIVYELPAVIRGGDGAGVDGLLGRDVLDAFTLSVDAASGRATLTLR
jgi:Aspartyl protease/Domain of unknown function (DUF4124)